MVVCPAKKAGVPVMEGRAQKTSRRTVKGLCGTLSSAAALDGEPLVEEEAAAEGLPREDPRPERPVPGVDLVMSSAGWLVVAWYRTSRISRSPGGPRM